ncbi:MAG: hypothetical protein M0P73_10040 [Syntrophobacterales bacterium]|jgi:hypothetical protein|nr:hypothetical protein [Syntrophobacterales bacterium]
MKDTFVNLLYESLLKIKIFPSFLITVTLSIILWTFKPDVKLSIVIILPIILILLLLIATLFIAAYDSHHRGKHILPRVILGRESSSRILCVLEPSPLFSHDTLVSFYFNEGFEQLIGFGRVINVQQDGKIQVILIKSFEEYVDIITKMSKNDSTILTKIIVKPTVPKAYIDPYLEEIKND